MSLGSLSLQPFPSHFLIGKCIQVSELSIIRPLQSIYCIRNVADPSCCYLDCEMPGTNNLIHSSARDWRWLDNLRWATRYVAPMCRESCVPERIYDTLKYCSKLVSDVRQAVKAIAQATILHVFAEPTTTPIPLPAVWLQNVILATSYVCISVSLSLFRILLRPMTAAANFSTVLCTSVNVTLPVFLGCNNASSLVTSSIGDVVDSISTSSTTLQGALESQLSLITTAAVATFTGGRLLTGSCSLPQFASMTLPASGLLEYPWVGCSDDDPGCCPFPIQNGGKLSVCPADYVTTSDACCPS